jgi:protein SCO1/2
MTRRSLLIGTAASGSTLALALSLRSLSARARAAPEQRPVTPAPGSIYALGSLWTSDLGTSFRLQDLAGAYVVVALIFTRCPSVCPTLVRRLRAAAQRMPEAVRSQARFALFSIDPEHDSVAALHAYREQHGLDVDHFTLARADADAVRELGATLGFGFSTEAGNLPTHSKLITLLDRAGRVVLQRADLAADPDLVQRAIQSALGAEGAR